VKSERYAVVSDDRQSFAFSTSKKHVFDTLIFSEQASVWTPTNTPEEHHRGGPIMAWAIAEVCDSLDILELEDRIASNDITHPKCERYTDRYQSEVTDTEW